MNPRTILSIFLILSSSYTIVAQKQDDSVKFLNDYVKNTTEGKIIYTEKIWPSNLDQIKTALSKEIVQVRDPRFPDTKNELPEQIVFTKKELQFVLKQILKNDKKGWIKNKVFASQFIARDTIDSHLKKKSSDYDYYSFSKPIFLRNKSICIFYSDGNDSGRLATYAKINGKWKYHSSFFRWIS